MFINIYENELSGGCDATEATGSSGTVYHGVRLRLRRASASQYPPLADNRGAITFWLPKTAAQRKKLANTFREMADLVDRAPLETELG